MDGSWDGDCGLVALKRDCGCFLHPQGEQELLAWGQLPQGLERSRAEPGARGHLRCPTNRINWSISQHSLTEHLVGAGTERGAVLAA